MNLRSSLSALTVAFFCAGCAGGADFEADTTSAQEDSLLADFSEGGHSIAIYRTPEGMLLIKQSTPALATPLVTAETMAGLLPSEVFSELTGEDPPAALLDAEREFAIERAPMRERLPVAQSEELGHLPETAKQVPTGEAPVHTRTHDADVQWFKTNFCNTTDVVAAFVPEADGQIVVAVPIRVTADKTVTRSGVSWGYVAGFNIGTSGNLITKSVIDVTFGRSDTTPPRSVQNQFWFSGWRETCSIGGCFSAPMERQYKMGIVGFNPGEVGATCAIFVE
jgi:hypothetical protein